MRSPGLGSRPVVFAVITCVPDAILREIIGMMSGPSPLSKKSSRRSERPVHHMHRVVVTTTRDTKGPSSRPSGTGGGWMMVVLPDLFQLAPTKKMRIRTAACGPSRLRAVLQHCVSLCVLGLGLGVWGRGVCDLAVGCRPLPNYKSTIDTRAGRKRQAHANGQHTNTRKHARTRRFRIASAMVKTSVGCAARVYQEDGENDGGDGVASLLVARRLLGHITHRASVPTVALAARRRPTVGHAVAV